MKSRRIIFVCNALEDTTRVEREIDSDSPAASKKTFEMAKALSKAGEDVVILSMGRGRPNRTRKYYKSKSIVKDGMPVIYAPFSQVPILSQCLSFISMPYLLYRIRNYRGKTTTVFYNRTTAYISSLLISVILRYSRFLDLEDGELIATDWSMYNTFLKFKKFLYDKLCADGTILACSALEDSNRTRSGLRYYGAVKNFNTEISWENRKKYRFLLGGTVSYDTGAKILIDAINTLRNNPKQWADKLEFVITGKGDCLHYFEGLAKSNKAPIVNVMGRLTDKDYSKVVDSSCVGLALKPNTGMLANTTFPSKVVELASSGLLVLTTNISDVKQVLNDGAVYLENDSSDSLLECLQWIAENPQSAEALAQKGVLEVKSHCDIETAGHNLSNYLFKNEL